MFIFDINNTRINLGFTQNPSSTRDDDASQENPSSQNNRNRLTLSVDAFVPSSEQSNSNSSDVVELFSRINNTVSALLQQPDFRSEVRRVAALFFVRDMFLDELRRRVDEHKNTEDEQARRDLEVLPAIDDPVSAINFLKSLDSNRLSPGTRSLIEGLISLCETYASDLARADASKGRTDRARSLASLHSDNPDVASAINNSLRTAEQVNQTNRDRQATREQAGADNLNPITNA